jgi:hypothetical protein
MNFLQLCQRLNQEVGELGNAGSVPAATTNQTGRNRRLVNWIAQAYAEIQDRYTNWRWLRSTFTVNATSGDDTYAGTDCTDSRLSAAVSRFARWWLEDDDENPNIRIYLSSSGVSGERYLIPIPWNYFRDLYKKGTQTNGPPVHVTIDPQNNIVLGPKPDDTYVVTGEYQMAGQALAADADTPEMPSRFHMLIVYEAMKKYAGHQSAPEVMSRAVLEGNKVMRQLEADQLPRIRFAGPLA